MDGENLPQAIGEIPWGHNIVLLFKLEDPIPRLWYAQKIIEHGWSRAVLVHQIESGLHEREGKAVTNFDRTLPPPQSDLARQALKDPYVFDFLTLAEDAAERELEQGLLAHIRKFLLELGTGFAFVGQPIRQTLSAELNAGRAQGKSMTLSRGTGPPAPVFSAGPGRTSRRLQACAITLFLI